MSRRRVLAAAWLLVLGLSSTLPLTALLQGIVHVGPGTVVAAPYTTEPIIALGTDVLLPAGSRSIVLVVGGDIVVQGRATKDQVAIDGRIYLSPHSRAEGDVLSILGGIYKSPTAVATGQLGGAVHGWNGRSSTTRRDVRRLLQNSIRLGLAAGLALLLAGTCVTVVFPWQVVLISTTLRSSPWKSIGAAAMIMLTFTFLVVPLGLSLAGLPFALLLIAAASLAWLFGMTASAVIVGRSIARGPVSLVWASAAGLVAIALAMAVPFVGPMVVVGTGLIGAGALTVALLGRSRPATPLA